MSTASQPLMELLRNTPPPSISVLHDSVRSIPPPPLCPPPLTILKIVPPPPLPSHLSRICPPSAMQMTANQVATNSSYSSTHSQRTKKGAAESFHQDAARMQNKKGSSKIGRLNHSNNRDCRSRDTSHGTAARTRDVTQGQADRSRDVTQGQADRSRDVTHGQADRSRDTADGGGGWPRDCEISAEDAELVNVLKHLVNLFTMTSQVKTALSRVKPKPDDSGIQHQVSRTRALVESFREQLARRTVTLGRLIPPETTGKPEIPRELRTKDPAGGDVSPQPDTAAASPTSSPASQGLQGQDESPGGRTVTTQAAISSLQALVSGDAGADPLGGASRWASRVKRRFLAASRPVRRVSERLKAPHSSGRWQDGASPAGPGAAAVSTGSTAPDSTPSPAAVRRSPRPSSASSCCSSDGDAQTGSYFSPGCYVIDRAGRPVCADADAATTTAAATTAAAEKEKATGKDTGKATTAAAAGTAGTATVPPTAGPATAASVFGVPLSVLMAEVARKKKQQPKPSSDQTDADGSPRSAAATASTGAGTAEQSRRDRSWLTSSASAPPPLLKSHSGEEETELRAALDGLRRLRASDDPSSFPSDATATEAEVGDGEPEISPRCTTTAAANVAAAADRTGDADTPPTAAASTNAADGEDWMGMTTSFDEDWFLITEREEEEQRRKEEEAKKEANAMRKRERRDGEKDGEDE